MLAPSSQRTRAAGSRRCLQRHESTEIPRTAIVSRCNHFAAL